MAKFIINRDAGDGWTEWTVESERYGLADGYFHFTTPKGSGMGRDAEGGRVFSVRADMVRTIERSE